METENSIFLSTCIATIRDYLVRNSYFEYHLYSTVRYTIDHIHFFPIDEALYLRVNSEPDIWQIGTVYDKFFWIGSLFRREPNLSKIHQYEFTLVDIYKAGGTMNELVGLFLSILENVEHVLSLQQLSRLPLNYISYDDFSQDRTMKLENGWWIVTDYPAIETFYDTSAERGGNTSKFEIFHVRNNKRTEIGTAGQVGKNLSERYVIKGKYSDIKEKIVRKKFLGIGFGLERLLALYSQN